MRYADQTTSRRIAAVAVMIVAIVTTIATSPPMQTLEFTSRSGTIVVDAAHKTATQRFVIRLSPEALSDGPAIDAALWIDRGGLAPPAESKGSQAPGIPSASPTTPVQLFVAAIDAAADEPTAIANASGSPEAPVHSAEDPSPRPTVWEADASDGYANLPVNCAGPAPCEAGFRLVAQLMDPSVSEVSVLWHVEIRLSYGGSAWPSGASADVRIDQPIALAGAGPQMEARTASDRVTVGPDRPAAARLIEVSIGRQALSGAARPIAALSLQASGGGYAFPASWTGVLYPVSPPNVKSGTLASPAPLDQPGPGPDAFWDGADPFASCPEDADCVRQFVVAFSWVKAGETTIDWQILVRRVGFAAAWSSPAEISARIVKSYDIDPRVAPVTVHLEGTHTTAGGFLDSSSLVFSAETTTHARDPIVAALPVPGFVRFDENAPAQDSTSPISQVSMNVQSSHLVTDFAGYRPDTFYGEAGPNGAIEIAANLFTGCHPGEACPTLTIGNVLAGDGSPVPALTFAWSLDVVMYSYVGIPIGVTATKGS